MKDHVYVILLLMCIGLAHSATQVRGGCLFGSQVLGIGAHTFHPCMRMICDTIGQITFVSCPSYDCDHLPNQEIVSWIPRDDTKDYPYCCPQPICRRRNDRFIQHEDYTIYTQEEPQTE